MLLVVAVLGATGVAYRAGAQAPPTDTPRVERPRNELEALRKENELLRLNLQVVLEKVRAQEAELRGLRGAGASEKQIDPASDFLRLKKETVGNKRKVQPDGENQAEQLDRIKKLHLLRNKLLG